MSTKAIDFMFYGAAKITVKELIAPDLRFFLILKRLPMSKVPKISALAQINTLEKKIDRACNQVMSLELAWTTIFHRSGARKVDLDNLLATTLQRMDEFCTLADEITDFMKSHGF